MIWEREVIYPLIYSQNVTVEENTHTQTHIKQA